MPLFFQLRERFLIERVFPVLTADDVVDAALVPGVVGSNTATATSMEDILSA